MRLFRRKRDDFIDLTERYKKQQERAKEVQASQAQSSDAGGLGFFGAIAQTASETFDNDSDYINISEGAEEKRRRLTKRLMDMTEKIEEISNQIYHLQQRLELLERKMGVGNFD